MNARSSLMRAVSENSLRSVQMMMDSSAEAEARRALLGEKARSFTFEPW